MRGLFIVFEGIDRVGKTTQVQRLMNSLQNSKKQKVESTRIGKKTTKQEDILGI